ncbi:hypothetical protein RHMOL_Rhmol01G0122100 [Rhododendron molle]|uniref:Uncharacterized protein n=1 Tax=Rhododendron molle TaxID=49168 RepID=A0ACC0Q3K7_RHOML|nr:hypothetical protein RHMOL_Rhmol01G0122100 [Rhododendron molle]
MTLEPPPPPLPYTDEALFLSWQPRRRMAVVVVGGRRDFFFVDVIGSGDGWRCTDEKGESCLGKTAVDSSSLSPLETLKRFQIQILGLIHRVFARISPSPCTNSSAENLLVLRISFRKQDVLCHQVAVSYDFLYQIQLSVLWLC